MASDLTSDWKDGSKFYLLLHLYSPDSLPTENLNKMSDIERLTQAFNTAEKQYGKLQCGSRSDEDIVGDQVKIRAGKTVIANIMRQ